jgi:hypothetical protein
MQTEDEARRARAEQRRRTMVGGRVSAEDDLPPVGRDVQERLEMLAEISARAWALTGEPVPTWTRAEMPGRVVRREPRGSGDT